MSTTLFPTPARNRDYGLATPGSRHGPVCRGYLATALCAALLTAQTPENPPPWWGVPDENSVSLYWSFDNALQPFVPTLAELPSWYVSPPNDGFTTSPNIVHIATLAGQPGVIGFTGPGNGTISTEIDNDPRPDWIKLFWMQYDSFETSTGQVLAAISKDLPQYDRSILSEESHALGNGWHRTTLKGYLIPQPDDETVDFTMSETGQSSVAIDNLFINSKCVKPPPDEDGDAMGEQDSGGPNINAGVPTGNANISCATLTEDPGTGVLTYWVGGISTTNANQVFRLTANGGLVPGSTPIVLPNPMVSPVGPTDMTVAVLPTQSGRREFVVEVIDRRPNGGGIVLMGVDTQLAAHDPLQNRPITASIGPGPLGLAFFPHGDGGAGTFWITDQAGTATEVDLSGALLRQLTPANNGMPTGISGAGYDQYTGRFYWFSNTLTQTPQGSVQVAGFEHSAYDFQPTGTKFFGDLTLNSGGILQPGGTARGLDVTRLSNGDFRMLCVQRVGNASHLRVLKGPFSFGWSLLGRCGMAGDPPMEGATNFNVTLSGVRHARFAMLYAGFSNTQMLGPPMTSPLPFSLSAFGMPESSLSVSLDMNSTLQTVVNGEASYTIPMLPPGSGFSYVPMFFQWIVFDASLPAGIAMSQSGKTVIY